MAQNHPNLTIDRSETGKQIRHYMRTKGYTAHALASVLQLSDGALKNYLYGRNLPPLDVLLQMRQLFGLQSVEDLLVVQEKEVPYA